MQSFSLLFASLAMLLATPSHGAIIQRVVCDTSVEGDIYGFSEHPLDGTILETVDFDIYRDQVVLISNVATYDARTTQRYTMLNELMTTFAGQPFTVIGFPCNQFNREEPTGDATEIYNGLYYVRPGNGFTPAFDMYALTEVNGETEDDLFTFLKSGCSYTEEEFNTDLIYTPQKVSDIRQAFEMFLVDKTGKVQFRYHAALSDDQILLDDISNLINA